VTSVKVNKKKNKEVRFLIKQISRGEIEKKKAIKKQCKKIAIKRIMTKFNVKIK